MMPEDEEVARQVCLRLYNAAQVTVDTKLREDLLRDHSKYYQYWRGSPTHNRRAL